jgi:hypothetical protein
MQIEPLPPQDPHSAPANYGWALYVGVAALAQIAIGVWLAVTYAWGWLVAAGMVLIAALLARRAWEFLGRPRRGHMP